ncbi:MAG: hypothetical protein E6Q97_30455 [Desulfurellales bacterium]|nr:MAG: hypothetical protein E6Q97_30455 [Desulfurellales bacterium]
MEPIWRLRLLAFAWTFGCLSLGDHVGRGSSRRQIEDEAIRNGVAERVIMPDGSEVFRWVDR